MVMEIAVVGGDDVGGSCAADHVLDKEEVDRDHREERREKKTSARTQQQTRSTCFLVQKHRRSIVAHIKNPFHNDQVVSIISLEQRHVQSHF